MPPFDPLQPCARLRGAVVVDRLMRASTWRVASQVVLVLGALTLYGAWRAPVPGVNEPHYLTKARHFWDPTWCSRDLFLESVNVHWVFYATIGSLTHFFSFEVSAWIGRILAWIALAAGWVAMSRRLTPLFWAPVWSFLLFLGLSLVGNFSGEWLIGGVEAKGFAYAALFFAFAQACAGSAVSAAVAAGIATSFHPVIGGWGIVALTLAALWQLADEKLAAEGSLSAEAIWFSRIDRRRLVLAAVLGTLCSLPGLIPAVSMIFAKIDSETARAADRIQVFDRLGHHLDPRKFTPAAWCMYGGLLVAWVGLRPWRIASEELRFFYRFVAGTLIIAAVGIAVGIGPRWPGVLKFYPFRLADLFLPIAVSLTAAIRLEDLGAISGDRRTTISRTAIVLGHGGSLAILAAILFVPARDQNPTRWTERQHADWRDLCLWMKANSPDDALCLTPRLNYTFRWHAQRAEFAIWKDCPQDAASLLEWRGRLRLIENWRKKHHKTGFTASALNELHVETGIDYVIAWYVDPYRIAPVYRTPSFSVYRISVDR